MAGRFSVNAVFKAVDRVSAPVTRMQNRVGKLTRSMGRDFHRLNRVVGKFTSGVKKAGLAVVAALALSSGAMANIIGTGAEFEQTLVNAAAKFPGEIRKGTKAFKALEVAARKTGATTEFTASQSAQALNFLAMAGFDAESSISALPGVVNLATASQVDLATATDIASDSLGAFGLMSKDASKLGTNLARVNDVIAKTTTTANTTVETFFETIKDGAPVATTAGASLETFAALAGVLANSGIKGSKAGTTLKNMFLSLAAPTTGAAKVLKRLGVQTKDANGDVRDIVDILHDLNIALDGLGTADRSGILEGIFGKIPIAGVNVLLASGSKRLREYRRELESASGASSTMASVMRDTLQGRLNSLKSAIEGVKISIFSMSNGPLSDVIDKTTKWVRANEKLIATKVGGFLANIIDNFDNIVKWMKRIGVGLAVFLALTTILKTLALTLTVVNLVMAANPIVLIILGIMALIAAIAAVIIWWDKLTGAFLNSGKAIDIIIAGIALLTGPIGWLIGAASLIFKHWNPIKNFFGDLWSGVVNIFKASLSKIMSVVDRVRNAASAIVDTISNIGGGVAKFFGFGSDDNDTVKKNTTGPQIVSPSDRVARSIEEQKTTSTAEVTIRDETGRAEVTGGSLGTGIALQPSGAF